MVKFLSNLLSRSIQYSFTYILAICFYFLRMKSRQGLRSNYLVFFPATNSDLVLSIICLYSPRLFIKLTTSTQDGLFGADTILSPFTTILPENNILCWDWKRFVLLPTPTPCYFHFMMFFLALSLRTMTNSI